MLELITLEITVTLAIGLLLGTVVTPSFKWLRKKTQAFKNKAAQTPEKNDDLVAEFLHTLVEAGAEKANKLNAEELAKQLADIVKKHR